MTHRNDEAVIRRLLTTPATWAVAGLSANTERTAYEISTWVQGTLGMRLIPLNPKGEDSLGAAGYPRLADIPDGEQVAVVEMFVNSSRVGGIVDEAIAERERLGIGAVWLQEGVIDEEAAQRAADAGLDVVMDTCPHIEGPRLGIAPA